MPPLPRLRSSLLQSVEWYLKTDVAYLIHGGFWLSAGQALSSLASFALTIAFANLIDPATYGVYRYVISVAAILTIPTLTGINTALTQAISHNETGTVALALRTRVMWGFWSGLASIACAAYYFFLTENHTLSVVFLIAAIFLPFMDPFGIYDALLQGNRDFRRSSLYLFFSQTCASICIFFALFFTHNLYAIVFAYFAGWTFARYIALRYSLSRYPSAGDPDPEVIRYGKHLSVIGIFGTVAGYADRLIVFHFFGAVDLAVYSFAIAPISQVRGLTGNLPALIFPKLSRRSFAEINGRFMERIGILAATGLALTLIYIALAPLFYHILFPAYIAAIPLSQVFALTIIVSLPLAFTNPAFRSKPEFLRDVYLIDGLGNAALLGLLFVGAAYAGIMGIIVARVVAPAIGLLIAIGLWRRRARALERDSQS